MNRIDWVIGLPAEDGSCIEGWGIKPDGEPELYIECPAPDWRDRERAIRETGRPILVRHPDATGRDPQAELARIRACLEAKVSVAEKTRLAVVKGAIPRSSHDPEGFKKALLSRPFRLRATMAAIDDLIANV